ncbi:MAG: hypothetical protein PWQ76_1070 [Clostridiales bacterium]|nr:hypothetical protein [Clostridiales bacterium]
MGLETFFSPSEQAAFFLYSVLIGACLGVVFDVFRALRAIIPHTPFFVGVEDILFAAVWGLSLIVFSMELCRGEIRIYYFIGNVLGFTLYFFTVGKIVVGAIRKIAGFLSKALKFLFELFARPVRLLGGWIFKIIKKLALIVSFNLKKFSNNAKSHLKDERKMMYNKAVHKKREKKVSMPKGANALGSKNIKKGKKTFSG